MDPILAYFVKPVDVEQTPRPAQAAISDEMRTVIDDHQHVLPESDQSVKHYPTKQNVQYYKVTAGPSPRHWEHMKDKIKELWLTQSHTLDEVRQIMFDRYRFRASKKVYKTWLKKWGFRKNYDLSQKDAALANLAEGMPAGKVLIYGQPVKLRRLVRHGRQKQRSRSAFKYTSVSELHSMRGSSSTLSSVSSANIKYISEDNRGTVIINNQTCSPRCSLPVDIVKLNTPEDLQCLERLLYATKQCYDQRLEDSGALFSEEHNLMPYRIAMPMAQNMPGAYAGQHLTLSVPDSFFHLPHRWSSAWNTVNTICKRYPQYIQGNSCDMLATLMLSYYGDKWTKFPELRTHLLDYMSSWTRKIRGPTHPLTTVLSLSCNETVRRNAFEPALRLFLDVTSRVTQQQHGQASLQALPCPMTDQINDTGVDSFSGDQRFLAHFHFDRRDLRTVEALYDRLWPRLKHPVWLFWYEDSTCPVIS